MAIKCGLKVLTLCAICLSLTVAGCGRRGALEVPGQQQTPSLYVSDSQQSPTSVDSSDVTEVPPKKSPFFLDIFIETW